MCVDGVTVFTPDVEECSSHRPVHVTNHTGFLASITSAETGCGTSEAPWSIEALPGQRINITLLDFAGSDVVSSSADQTSDGLARVCRVYATIRESSDKRSMTVCGGESRVKTVHVSSEHQVELRVISSHSPPQPVSFIFRYQSKCVLLGFSKSLSLD